MRKKLLSVLLCVSMAATLLTGCGKGSAKGDVQISFYTTETGKDDMFLDVIADFEKKNPGIKVEYIAAGDDQLAKWMSLYASNEGPTVSFMDPINIYENKDRMLEFTKDNAPFLANIQEAALSTLTFDGGVYGAPGSAAGIGILYNKAVCDKAVGGNFDPASIKTRSDLEALFEKIEATGVAASCLTGVNWSLGAHYLCQSYGAAVGDVNARIANVASIKAGTTKIVDDPIFNGYMDTFDLLAKYNVNKADPLVGDVNHDAEALASGKCGTWFMGDWAWTYMAALVQPGQEFGLLPIPYSDNASDAINQCIPTSYAKAYCVDKSQNDEKKQAAGLKFVEYLTSDEYCEEQFAKVCGQAFPYKNFKATIDSPLGQSTADYIAKSLVYDFYGTADLCPSDFWYDNGATMCKYLSGACDRAELADSVQKYWAAK